MIPRGRNGGLVDHYGECVLLSIGLGEKPDDSFFDRVALSPNLHHCERMIDALEARAAGEEIVGVRKIRYWNGTSALTRPIVAVLGVEAVRVLAAASLLAAIALVALLVRRRLGALAVAGFLVPLVTIDLTGLFAVFHHPFFLAVGFVGAAAVGRAAAADAGHERLTLTAVLAGSVYSFFDLMNFVMGVWGLTIALAGLMAPSRLSMRARAGRMGLVSAGWASGYIMTWASKWVLAAVATSPSAVIEEISEQFRFRIDGRLNTIEGTFGAGLRATVGEWLNMPLNRVLIALVVLAVAVGLVVKVRQRESLAMTALIAFPALFSVPFMLAANNHHETHYWLEFRSLGLGLSVISMTAGAAIGGHIHPAAASSERGRARHT